MSHRDRALVALVPLAAMQLVGVICGIIGVRWSSAVIPPEVLGAYGLLLSTVQLALVVTHQGLVKHVQRHWSPAIQPRTYVTAMLRGSGRSTLFLFGAVVAVLALLHAIADVPFNVLLIAWAAIANLLAVVAASAQYALQTEHRTWAAFGISAVGSVTRSFLPPLLAMLAGATLFWVNTGFLLHVIAQSGIAALLLATTWRRPGEVPPEATKSVQRSLGAFAGVGLCAWLASVAPRWLGAILLEPDELGYFILAGNLAAVVPAIVGGIAFNYSFPPLFAAARESAETRTLLRKTNLMVVVVMVGSQLGLLALVGLAPWLLGIVIHARYADALGWLLATGGAAMAATTTQFYHNLLLARNRETDCLWLSLGSAAVRLAIIGTAGAIGLTAFRGSLIALPWVAVVFEAWYARTRILQSCP